MSNTDIKATLSFSDGSPSVDFPIYKGSIGPDVIDIRKLYGATGKFTYDPGFMSTASCNSSITYIDGDKGELLYRGYPIEQLAVNCDFLESCYLLLHGELPNATQKEEFVKTVTQHTMVHEQMNFFFRGFRRDAHPMAVLTGSVGALSAFYHDSLDISNANHREVSAIRMIAKLPTLVAINVWKGFPFVTVMVLAGLQAIPADLYEAAKVDGASFWEEQWHITLPQVRPVLVAVTLLLLIWGINGITLIYAITRGGPANLSLITPIQIYQLAFESFQFNEAAALSVLLFIVAAIIVAIYLRVIPSSRGDAR